MPAHAQNAFLILAPHFRSIVDHKRRSFSLLDSSDILFFLFLCLLGSSSVSANRLQIHVHRSLVCYRNAATGNDYAGNTENNWLECFAAENGSRVSAVILTLVCCTRCLNPRNAKCLVIIVVIPLCLRNCRNSGLELLMEYSSKTFIFMIYDHQTLFSRKLPSISI